ncbi:hypothetical protein [Cystobacter ferrugineus]|nr:hypothetical protein [Cystobacter ferrugineus]
MRVEHHDRRTRNTGTKRHWAVVLGALALWLGPRAWAQPGPGEEGTYLVGTVLVEGPLHTDDVMGSAHRIACEGRFCLWRIIEEMGPCASYRCANVVLTTSDLKGHALGASWSLSESGEDFVRFLGPRQVEVLSRRFPGYAGPDPDRGLDGMNISRQVLKLSADGRKLTRDAEASRGPEWRYRRVPPAEAPQVTPGERRPVSESVLAQARTACEANTTMLPWHHECRGKSCMLILGAADERNDNPEEKDRFCGSLCFVLVKGSEVRRLYTFDSDDCVTLTPSEYVVSSNTGPYGSREDGKWISRVRPGYMSFNDTAGAHVRGANPYPVREAKTFEAARALAPTVHADTLLHVTWGQKGWRGTADLSLAWQMVRVGEQLQLHAEVDDDVVVPFSADAGTGVHSDHLELTVWRPARDEPSVRMAPDRTVLRKLGVLLAEGGQVQVRLWTGSGDAPYAPVQGTWSRSEWGYSVDVTLPLDVLQESKPLVGAMLTVMASDADAGRKQESLMGHEALLRFWTEWPPSLDEYRIRTEGSLEAGR